MPRLLCLMLLLLASNTAIAGSCGPEDGKALAGTPRKIDGPANVRELPDPKSKIVASLPDHSDVVLLDTHAIISPTNQTKSWWYQISWKNTQTTASESGWTHEKNIICD